MKASEIKLSNGCSQYGAQMGRRDRGLVGPFVFRKVRMSLCGAYDEGGAYWGIGTLLYVAQDAEGNQSFVRAHSRREAKELFLKE